MPQPIDPSNTTMVLNHLKIKYPDHAFSIDDGSGHSKGEICFSFNDTYCNSAMLSCCGRFEVHPREWAIELSDAKLLDEHNHLVILELAIEAGGQ